MKLRFVLDTNQIIAAGGKWLVDGQPTNDPNVSRRILIAVVESHTGLYSGKIMGEYIEKLIDINHPPATVERMMTYLMGAFQRVEIKTKVAPYPPSDKDDEIFVLCAMDGNADYLVSDDKAVTALKPHYNGFVIGKSSEIGDLLGI